MPARLSYINARGVETVLDDDEHTMWYELQGRTGFEAPTIETESVTYGDGSTRIISVTPKERAVTCYFWSLMERSDFERRFNALKQSIMQIGNRDGNWGKLKIRREDGSYVYLNCVYTGGLDSTTRDSHVRILFYLTFTAVDPYFYSSNETSFSIKPYQSGTYLHFRSKTAPVKERFHFGNATYFRSADTAYFDIVKMDCAKVNPTITIVGPAQNISIENKTNGKKIAFEPEFKILYGETVVIQTESGNRSCTYNQIGTDGVNGLSYLTADTVLDFSLDYGDNKLIYTNAYVDKRSSCKFSYKEGWLSA